MAPRKLGKAAAASAEVAANGAVSAPKKMKTAAAKPAVEPKQSKTGRDRQPKAVKQVVVAEPDKFSPMHLRLRSRKGDASATNDVKGTSTRARVAVKEGNRPKVVVNKARRSEKMKLIDKDASIIKGKSKKKPARKVAKLPEEAEIEERNAAIEDDSKTKSLKNIKKNAKKVAPQKKFNAVAEKMLQLPADEAQLEEAASSKIDVERNGDVHMAELRKKRNPKEVASQRKLAATGKAEAQLEEAAISQIDVTENGDQVAELKTKRNARKAAPRRKLNAATGKADEAQLEEAASSKIDVEENGDVHMAELKKKRNPKEVASQRKLAATGKAEAQLEEAAISQIDVKENEDQVAELKTKRNPKEAASQRKLAATEKADKVQLEKAAISQIDIDVKEIGDQVAELKTKRNARKAVPRRKLYAATEESEDGAAEGAATSEINIENGEAQVAELKTKRNAKKANAAMNTDFDVKKKKKEQAPALSMATTAAVDEKETTEDATIESDNSIELVTLFADAPTTILNKTPEDATTKNSRACIDEMTVSLSIDKGDTRDISLNKHNDVLENEVIIKIDNKTP